MSAPAVAAGCTAFVGARRIASGDLVEVALEAKAIVDEGGSAPVLIFDDVSGELIEVDFRGAPAEMLQRLAEQAGRGDGAAQPPQTGESRRGPGRPKLGVVAREVTLLPRHWQWLGSQPGGASVALRKLVDEARRANVGRDRVRQSQEAAYRFMSTMAGDAPGFEEAARALFAGSSMRFSRFVEPWPSDIGDHAKTLASAALEEPSAGAA